MNLLLIINDLLIPKSTDVYFEICNCLIINKALHGNEFLATFVMIHFAILIYARMECSVPLPFGNIV